MAKIKIAVAGCLGRMGQEISKQILQNKNLEFVGGFEHKKHKDINKPLNKVSSIHSAKLVTANAAQLIKDSNVIIDFTTPESTLDNLKIASANKTAVVIGTTGMTDAQKKKVKSYSKKIPILMSSNMSLGVNLLFNLVKIPVVLTKIVLFIPTLLQAFIIVVTEPNPNKATLLFNVLSS